MRKSLVSRNPLRTLETLETLETSYLSRSDSLQLQSYIDEVVRRPGTGVLEFQALAILFGDGVDRLIEFGLTIAFYQKSRIHDHFIADWLIVA